MTETTPAPRASDAVRVKELVWEMVGPAMHYAQTPFGEYWVDQGGWRFQSEALQFHNSTEAAKAAAQSDYNARILSALEPPVASSGGMAEAVDLYAAYLKWLNGDDRDTVMAVLRKHWPIATDMQAGCAIIDVVRALVALEAAALSLRSTEAVEPVAVPDSVKATAKYIADALGVTPTSDTRPYIIRAVELAHKHLVAASLARPVAAQQEGWAETLADLASASRKVLDGLNARIDAADGDTVPVFYGIVYLHDALNRAEEALAAAKLGRP